jgi:hypothetical protein
MCRERLLAEVGNQARKLITPLSTVDKTTAVFRFLQRSVEAGT